MYQHKKPIVFFLFLLFKITLSAQTTTISGQVLTAEDKPVTNVVLQLTAGNLTMTATTDIQGNYSFSGVPTETEIAIIPTKVDNPLNGVSTFDQVLGNNHILVLEIFDTPDKYIAMDINRSGSVTIFDLIILRQLVLGLTQVFPNNDAWRFVEANQLTALDISGSEITENFANSFTVNDQALTLNFIGIKIGDANYSANP